MTRYRGLRAALAFLPPALAIAACGSPKETVKVATVSARCPDVTKADDLSTFDFAAEYNLSRDAADKLRAAALAGIEISLLADKLDAELGIACAQVAHALGNKGDWRSGNDACGAAIKAVHDARTKLGAKHTTRLVLRTPVCASDASLMTKCASICDSSAPAGRVKAECSQKAGRCDGNCDGICEVKSAVKCDGVCSGSCDGTLKGACGGRCRGTCDGRPWNGLCAGACVGTCDKGTVNGECKGACSGSCKSRAPGICDGLCAGTCTVELTDAKCAGEFSAPDVSTDCRARCELLVINQTECSTPQVSLIIGGAARDRETVDALRTAVEKAFPALLKTLFEVGDTGAKRILNAQAVIEGARKGFAELGRSGGAATAAAAEAQITTCFDDAFAKASAAAASVKTGLDQARAVKDEAAK